MLISYKFLKNLGILNSYNTYKKTMAEADSRKLVGLSRTEYFFHKLHRFKEWYTYTPLSIEPVAAGVLTSLGGTFGKLSGSEDVVGDSYIIWVLMLILMVIFNTWGCRCFLRALDQSLDSVTPTVICSAISFLISALIEVKMFNGNMSFKWLIGIIFILKGIGYVASFKCSPPLSPQLIPTSNCNRHLSSDSSDDSDDEDGGGDNDDDDGSDDIEDEIFGYGIEQYFANNDEQLANNDEQLVNNIGHYFSDRRRLG